ncbi:hypothetical protein B7463_g2507, partial [Scytalidium lignicola]
MMPCFHCHTSRRECVYPHRVRKRRSGPAAQNREEELFTRIKHLENLVDKIATSTGPTDSREELTTEEPHHSSPLNSTSVITQSNDYNHKGGLDDNCLEFIKRQESGSQHIGHTLWTMLSVEVGGLRKLLEDTADEEYEHDQTVSNSPDMDYSPNVLLNHPGGFPKPEHPSDLHRSILARFYFSNVHPLCKILHRPTIMASLNGTAKPGDKAGDTCESHSLEAVAFGMYFAALTSMSTGDCAQFLGSEKELLVIQYKQKAEAALSRADFLNSMEIATLQAFTLYIMAMRSHTADRSSWTLVATAVRIAHALGLHRDGDGRSFTAFDAEMRRRLWWEIFVLDMRASEDRGSELMILDGSFNTIIPNNLDDEDFGLESLTLPPSRSGITEMAFCLICMDVSDTVLKISFIPPFKERRVLTFTQKEELVKECTKRIDSNYLKGANPSTPFGWMACTIGQLLILKMWLVVQYPLQCVYSTSQHFARGQSLRTAIAYLNMYELLEETESATRFLWLFETYVPWHALAVALAELCKESVGPLADQAWVIIDKGYGKWGERMADSKDGILWRPVKSLMKKARAAREHGQKLAKTQTSSSQPALELACSANNNDIDMQIQSPNPNQNHLLDQLMFGDFGSISATEYSSFDLGFSNSLGNYQSTTDQVDIESNWDYWNEFMFDVGAAYSNSAER